MIKRVKGSREIREYEDGEEMLGFGSKETIRDLV